MLPSNNNLVRFAARHQTAPKRLFIPNMGSDAEIVLSINDQNISGTKTLTSAIICNQPPTQNDHLTVKAYVDMQHPHGAFLKTDSSNSIANHLNMNENQVKNMLYPSDERDAVNKRFVEDRLDHYLSRKGQNRMVGDLAWTGRKSPI